MIRLAVGLQLEEPLIACAVIAIEIGIAVEGCDVGRIDAVRTDAANIGGEIDIGKRTVGPGPVDRPSV